MKELMAIQAKHTRARLLVLMVVIGMSLIALVSIIMAFKYTNDFSQRVYVLNRGVALEAMSSNVNDNRPAEGRFHVARFHELFYSVSPDASSIEANTKKAFFLCDESAKNLYDNLREQQFYQKLIQSNTTQRVKVDSVEVDFRTYPYHVRTVFTLIKERSTARTTQLFLSESDLFDVVRSDVNPNGFIMRNYQVRPAGERRDEVFVK